MAEVVIAQKKSFVVELKEGTYFWCKCGRSKNQPFCDGSHSGTGFSPVKFEITEAKKYALCGCKHSGKQHICDGTHKRI